MSVAKLFEVKVFGLSHRTIVMFSVIALTAMGHANSFAQSKKALSSIDHLLKSAGLSKPAMSAAPDFNLLDSNDRPVALSSHRGRMVLLNFWATWCGPCREEMPSMERLNRQFGGQGLTVLAVNQRENAALVNTFMKTHGLNFTTPMDTTGRVAGYYRIYGIPVSYLIDPEGQVIAMKSGPLDWAAPIVIDALRKLIDDGSGAGSGSMVHEPAKPLPGTLRGKTEGVMIRSRHDTFAEVVGRIERSEDVIVLGKVSGAGEFWYMVKSKSGVVGWARGVDVDENSPPK